MLDEEYLELENMMLSEIEINDKININNIYNILKALKTNVSRIANKEKLFQIFLSYFENEYSRFYMEISEIINIIEKSFSANVYSTVKREDEKYITEKF